MGGAGERGVARTGRAQAAADPWAAAVAGLQRNAAQLGDNLQRSVQRMMHAKRVRPQAEQQASQRRPFSASLASVSQAANAAAGAAAIVVAAAAAPPPAAAPATAWSGGSHGSGGGTVSKEEVGRATWTFLHTLAAQYPERPSRRQKTDARNLIDIMTRMYPCGECAQHFGELVKASPPNVRSRHDFSRWMCEAHNSVNRRLGKPTFNCALVEARWAQMECEGEDGGNACAMNWGK